MRNAKTQPPPSKIPARQELPSPEHSVQMVLDVPREGVSPASSGQAAPALSHSSAALCSRLLAPEVLIPGKERPVPRFQGKKSQFPARSVLWADKGWEELRSSTQPWSREKGLGRDFSKE